MREVATTLFPWKYSAMERRRETALCRLRIGHTRFTHGFLMSKDPPPFCDDCLVPQTVKHLLVECPSFGEARSKFLSSCRNREGSYNLEKIMVGTVFEIGLCFDYFRNKLMGISTKTCC